MNRPTRAIVEASLKHADEQGDLIHTALAAELRAVQIELAHLKNEDPWDDYTTAVQDLVKAAREMVMRADDDAPSYFWTAAIEQLREALKPFDP